MASINTRISHNFINSNSCFISEHASQFKNLFRQQKFYVFVVVFILLTASLYTPLAAAEERSLSISPTVATSGQTITIDGEGFKEGARAFVLDGGPFVTGGVQIPGFYNEITISGNFAYLMGRRDGLKVVDISQPQFPIVIGSVDHPHGSISSFAISGNYIYAVGFSIGLSVIDISDPYAPKMVGGLGIYNANIISVVDGFAYVTTGLGLTVVDISNPQGSFMISLFRKIFIILLLLTTMPIWL